MVHDPDILTRSELEQLLVQDAAVSAYFYKHSGDRSLLDMLLRCMQADGQANVASVLEALTASGIATDISIGSMNRRLARFRQGLADANLGLACRVTSTRSFGPHRRFMWFAQSRVTNESRVPRQARDQFDIWFSVWAELLDRVVNGEVALNDDSSEITLRVLLTFAYRLDPFTVAQAQRMSEYLMAGANQKGVDVSTATKLRQAAEHLSQRWCS